MLIPVAPVNPVILMLKNTTTNRFHPIIFWECPMPSQALGSAVRWKSKGHHTEGFEKRDDASAAIQDLAKRHSDMDDLQGAIYFQDDVNEDGHWDGVDNPASVMLFDLNQLTKYVPVTEEQPA
jgi:hypothetical protein